MLTSITQCTGFYLPYNGSSLAERGREGERLGAGVVEEDIERERGKER